MERKGLITAKAVKFSSVTGQTVMLLAEDGQCVAQLSVHISMGALGEQNFEKAARAVAKWTVEAFDALSEKHAVLDTLGAEALER